MADRRERRVPRPGYGNNLIYEVSDADISSPRPPHRRIMAFSSFLCCRETGHKLAGLIDEGITQIPLGWMFLFR